MNRRQKAVLVQVACWAALAGAVAFVFAVVLAIQGVEGVR